MNGSPPRPYRVEAGQYLAVTLTSDCSRVVRVHSSTVDNINYEKETEPLIRARHHGPKFAHRDSGTRVSDEGLAHISVLGLVT